MCFTMHRQAYIASQWAYDDLEGCAAVLTHVTLSLAVQQTLHAAEPVGLVMYGSASEPQASCSESMQWRSVLTVIHTPPAPMFLPKGHCSAITCDVDP